MKNVLLLGLGAIGSLVASKFSDNHVHMDVLLDDGRYERYKKKSFVVNDKIYKFNYVTNSSYDKKCDFVIIATKYNDLESALNQLDGLLSDDCVIMSLLNGIDSEAIIGKKFGLERCVYAFITSTDATRVGYTNRFNADGMIYFGEKDGSISNRTNEIVRLFKRVKMNNKLTTDIVTKQWKKFMVNIGMNQVSAVLNATYGDFSKSTEILDLTKDAMEEVVEIAQAKHIHLNEKDKQKAIDLIAILSPRGKTSMLQDVDAKRKTEVDMFAKVLIKMGEECNVPTPINKVLYQQIKAIESMY